MSSPFALLLAVSITDAAPGHTKGRAVKPFTSELKPGDYVWHPEVSPAGLVVVFVSLPEQVVYVYRNGVRIGRSTVSTGKPGKATPTGAFTVLQKKVDHESSIYKGAKMPHMQRLNWRDRCRVRGQAFLGEMRTLAKARPQQLSFRFEVCPDRKIF